MSLKGKRNDRGDGDTADEIVDIIEEFRSRGLIPAEIRREVEATIAENRLEEALRLILDKRRQRQHREKSDERLRP